MKKISMSVLLVFLLIGLMACSNEDSDSSNEGENTQVDEESTEQEDKKTVDKEELDISIDDKSDTEDMDKSEIKELKSELKYVVTSLATGEIDEDFYGKFNEDIVKTIKDAVQEGSDKKETDEELTKKFLNNYVQLSDKVEEFTIENDNIDKVEINEISKDEIEQDEETQITVNVKATIIAGNKEELPLNVLFDVTDDEYEYVNIASPRS